MEYTVADIIRFYEKRIGHCVSQEVAQLFALHNQQVKISYEQGYKDGQSEIHQNY